MGQGLDLASLWTRSLVLGSLLLAQSSEAALAIVYCSPDLTAGDFQAVYNTWQSNGACQTACGGQYDYAVLKGQNCWCSNYAPADQVSTYDCNTVCTGWPDDWCGNDSEGLYGYYVIPGVTPSGTAGGASSTSGASSSFSSVSNTPSSSLAGFSSVPLVHPSHTGGFSSLTTSATEQTSVRTTSSMDDSSSSTSYSASSVSSISSTTRSTSSSSSTITHSATPTEIYTSVTTVTGQVKTILVTPTPSSDSTLGSGSTINNNGGGVSTGKVVGIVLGVAIGLGLLIGLGVWFWLRRRNQRNAEAAAYENASSHHSAGIPSRQVSQLSSAGLLSKVPRIHTMGLPSGSNPRSAGTMGSNFDRRSLGTDQRLNPYAIYAHDESRHSNVSLQDNQDYSRQLRVANPDP